MEAEISRQKGEDMRDLTRRLVTALAGVRAHALEDMPRGTVLIATRLLPSDTVFLARREAAAVVLEVGGAASHAALFTHEIGLPCVSGIHGVVDLVPTKSCVLVDADAGDVIVNPDKKQQRDFAVKCQNRIERSKRAKAHANEPAVTKDGKTVPVFANVGGPEDTQAAVHNGADGIGLYRIERAYMAREEPPDTAELFEEIRKTLDPAKGLPVYIRLLDIGADKPLPFMEQHRESNPSLGCRGIRFLLKYPDLLQTQLDALLQLSSDWDLHVLVPMVTLPADIQKVRELLMDAASRTGITPMAKLGAMIETPAAALAVKGIVPYADFLSIGTNDLTQYTFAADRENAAVDSYFDDTHDVIFRLLKTIHDDVPDIPISICGELATRTRATGRILACGVTSLSVPPSSVPGVKEAVRTCTVV
jgi:phosphoenolpyruvate-protein kinase (PTS system EI component)